VQDHRLDDQVVWTPKFHSIWLARTEGVSVGEIVEVEVAVSRPGMPACAFDASQARSVARVTFSLVTSHKGIAAARLPRSKAVGKAPTLQPMRRAIPPGRRQEPTNAILALGVEGNGTTPA
jgi:hypothetical protein